jgi:APA family basic amino acid/polyamine antiporter
MRQIFQTKSIDLLIEQSEDPEHKLKRLLGPWSLIGLGVGAVIGTGIFVLTGTAAAGETIAVASIIKAPLLDLILNGADAVSVHGRPGAGPGIAISFLATAIICGFAALCYAELASMIPIAGSAYTYAYATLGELIAWIIGWDLILEYAVSNMAVAVGFSAYFNDVLDSVFGFQIPESLSRPIFEGGELTGAIFNLPAFLIVMALTVVLVWGIRES